MSAINEYLKLNEELEKHGLSAKAMRFDIEEGNLCDALLEKIGVEDSKKDNSSSCSSSLAPGLMNNDLDLLRKLQTQTP
jgi:hypothetical protein